MSSLCLGCYSLGPFRSLNHVEPLDSASNDCLGLPFSLTSKCLDNSVSILSYSLIFVLATTYVQDLMVENASLRESLYSMHKQLSSLLSEELAMLHQTPVMIVIAVCIIRSDIVLFNN